MNLFHRRFDPLALSPNDRLGRHASRLSVSHAPRRLVITCTDANCMEGRLERVDASRVVVIRTPANAVPTEGFAGSMFLSAIRSAVIRGNLNEILICGHSRCRSLDIGSRSEWSDDPALARPIRAGGLRLGPERLLRRMEASAALLAEAKRNVLAQLEALGTDPILSQAVERGDLTLRGWVHLDESGLFLAHDAESDRFEPIGEPPARDVI